MGRLPSWDLQALKSPSRGLEVGQGMESGHRAIRKRRWGGRLRGGGAHPRPLRLSHLLPLQSMLSSLALGRKHFRTHSLIPDTPKCLALR